MNLTKKIISICKSMPDFSAIGAGELHLCPKCLKFKKVMLLINIIVVKNAKIYQ